MSATRRLCSVGIDVGTTTTQVIFSALEVINRAPVNQVPRYEFSRRDILFESPVVFTPFTADRQVDVVALRRFVDAQYAAAALSRAEVESGAIIITGETSKSRNARSAVLQLADALGDFVVATAGPHLESLIAGRGSGAAEYSRVNACRVLNIDIGGGTSNYAVFVGGRLVDSACLNVGGHLVETDAQGRVTRVHEPARHVCASLWGSERDPQRLLPEALVAVAARQAELVVEVARGTPSPLAEKLLMTAPLRECAPYDALFVSGGVGACLYHPELASGDYAFGDLGPLLARALAPLLPPLARTLPEPPQTVRATVIGAGAHTLSLSGSTIWLDTARLPLKNLPVAHPAAAGADGLAAAWDEAVRRLDLEAPRDAYALALPAGIEPRYRDIVAVSAELERFCREAAPGNAHPLIVVCRQDLGKALGMELSPHLRDRELAVIDEVATQEGDFLDIGQPIFDGRLVPITVKSLAFPSPKEVAAAASGPHF